MHVKNLLIIAPLAAMLAACGTPYQPMAGHANGGFYERKHGTNSYMIAFSANSFTHQEDVYDFALLHAAEFGKERGFHYFIINDTRDGTTIEHHSTGVSTTTYNGTVTGSTVSGTALTDTGNYTARKPAIGLEVQYYDARPSLRE